MLLLSLTPLSNRKRMPGPKGTGQRVAISPWQSTTGAKVSLWFQSNNGWDTICIPPEMGDLLAPHLSPNYQQSKKILHITDFSCWSVVSTWYKQQQGVPMTHSSKYGHLRMWFTSEFWWEPVRYSIVRMGVRRIFVRVRTMLPN